MAQESELSPKLEEEIARVDQIVTCFAADCARDGISPGMLAPALLEAAAHLYVVFDRTPSGFLDMARKYFKRANQISEVRCQKPKIRSQKSDGRANVRADDATSSDIGHPISDI